MKRALPLLLAIAWHLSAHAADALPARLTGSWSTSATPAQELDAHNDIYLEADGFGVAVGSTKASQVPTGAGGSQETARVVLGFPVRATLNADTLTLTPFMPGKLPDAQAARQKLTCIYEAAAPALTCTGPDGASFRMRRIAETVDAEVAKMIAAFRTQAAQSGPVAVRTPAELDAALASGQPTPLDALTPYGKRRFIRGLRWGEHGLGGFMFAPLVRELDPAEARAVLRFIDSESVLPMLSRGLSGNPLRLPAPSPDLERHLDQLEQFAREDDERRANDSAAGTVLAGQAVLLRYRELFGERVSAAALRRQQSGDLPLLFDAAALAAGTIPDSPAFADLLRVHAELTARGIDTRRALDEGVLYAMLAARRFEQARTFAAGKPHLAHRAVPRVVDKLGPGFSGRSEFRYDAAGTTLTRVAAPPPVGMELVMVAGAGCHFSQDALTAIAGDTALQARLREAGFSIVTPPRSPIPLDYVTEWNTAHPRLPIRIPAYAQEWQAIDVVGTPEFYLLKDGKVVAKRSGWPAGGNRAALLELLDTRAR